MRTLDGERSAALSSAPSGASFSPPSLATFLRCYERRPERYPEATAALTARNALFTTDDLYELDVTLDDIVEYGPAFSRFANDDFNETFDDIIATLYEELQSNNASAIIVFLRERRHVVEHRMKSSACRRHLAHHTPTDETRTQFLCRDETQANARCASTGV